MLLPEESLDLLIDRLRRLSKADQLAIMRHLTFEERLTLEARMVPSETRVPVQLYSPSIEARIAALRAGDADALVSAATRVAVLELIGSDHRLAKPASRPSLIQSLAQRLRVCT